MTAPIWITQSGQISSVIEGSIFNFNLDYNGSNPIQVALISGALPSGLTLNSNTGNISGVIGYVEQQTDYEFTIRLTNSFGFSDIGLSILVLNQTPVWNLPGNLGSIPPNFYSEFNFSVTDPGGSTQTFEKISGTLPPGFSLNTFGKLYGISEGITVATSYSFIIRCFTDNSFIDQTFNLTIDPNAISTPIWLTPAGSLGNIVAGQEINQLVLAESPQNLPVSYSVSIGALPNNLTLNNTTGLISGALSSSEANIYSFSIIASAGVNSSSSRTFSFDANSAIINPVTWITPSGSIGTISEGQKSILAVQATSSSEWVRYVLSSGSLPEGLTIDINTGEIWGIPTAGQISSNTIFNFSIKAYNDYTSVIQNFTITLEPFYNVGATRIYTTIYGHPKLLFNDLFNTPEIIYKDLYRQGDSNFGLIETPKILLVENLNAPTPDQVADLLYGVRRTYLTFGKVLVGQAVINNTPIYEVLYRSILDSSAGAAETILPASPTPPYTLRPGSLTNIRAELIAAFGSSGGTDSLPLWMTSEQTIGDSSTIPGYVPCLEFCYVLPGTGQAIANAINNNDIKYKKLFQNRVRTDRIVMEPAADNSFAPQNILFDNQY